MFPSSSAPTRIGVLRELARGERRVALVPPDVKKLSAKGALMIERDAGAQAGFTDQAYEDAGALVGSAADVLRHAEIILKVRAPEAGIALRSGTVLMSLGGRDGGVAARLGTQGVVHLGLERLPRTTRAQAMDVLSSQASIAGYAAVIEGARMLDMLMPMMITAAGVIKPAKMIALGAGVAGLQALATARRLGAVTHGFDVREAAREQVESLAARFVFPDVEVTSSEGVGGYAGDQSSDQQERLRRALTEHLSDMDLIVTSAQIPGRLAPVLIDERALTAMKPGAVIIDLAAESGGNCTVTRPDEVVQHGGVRVFGPTNMTSQVAGDASRLFSGNMRSLLDYLIASSPTSRLDPADPILSALLAGQVFGEPERFPA